MQTVMDGLICGHSISNQTKPKAPCNCESGIWCFSTPCTNYIPNPKVKKLKKLSLPEKTVTIGHIPIKDLSSTVVLGNDSPSESNLNRLYRRLARMKCKSSTSQRDYEDDIEIKEVKRITVSNIEKLKSHNTSDNQNYWQFTEPEYRCIPCMFKNKASRPAIPLTKFNDAKSFFNPETDPTTCSAKSDLSENNPCSFKLFLKNDKRKLFQMRTNSERRLKLSDQPLSASFDLLRNHDGLSGLQGKKMSISKPSSTVYKPCVSVSPANTKVIFKNTNQCGKVIDTSETCLNQELGSYQENNSRSQKSQVLHLF